MPGIVIISYSHHYLGADGWFYVFEDGIEVGPFASEWEMFKYIEDRDINEPDLQNPNEK